jgi:16S rRNA (cytosine967-C5)-methyltransferase
MWLLESGAGPGLLSDVNQRRLREIPGELDRLGLSGRAEIARLSATEPLPGRTFPLVLVDAPCSGLGVLARRPDAKWKRGPEDVATLCALQARILENLADSVAPGGCLVYMTCTLCPAENQERVAAFLAARPDFRLAAEFQTPFDSPLAEFYYGARLDRTS